jgi:LysM repeat protein
MQQCLLCEGEKMMLNLKRSLRAVMMLLLVGLVVFGLASCRLPASKGPQAEATSTEEFPVPGGTEQVPSSSGVAGSATQTAQIILPVVIAPEQGTVGQAYPSPEATNAPQAPEPTSAPITYVEATPGGPPETYTLQEGEYPFCIARRFDVSQADLLAANNLTPESLFYAGQELKIPQAGNPFDGERMLQQHPTTYKIQEGDTLNSIACDFGDVSPDMIALQNNLSTDDLPVGEVLIIP